MAWDLQAFMIPVYGTEIGLDAVAIGWLLSTFSICTFAVRVFMPILSQMFKEWSIIIFVMISAGLTYIVFLLRHRSRFSSYFADGSAPLSELLSRTFSRCSIR